jgi:hypothetical protein
MAVYYYKGYPILAPLSIRSNEPFFSSDSVSLKHQRISMNVQRWELDFTVSYTGSENELFYDNVTNIVNVQTMTMPQLVSVDRLATTTVNGTVVSATTANTVLVPVVSSQTGGILPRGAFIQFSNHSKIYMVNNTVTTNTTSFNVSLFPRLQVDLAGGETVYFPGGSVGSQPQLSFFDGAENINGITYSDGQIIALDKVSIIEAI